MVRQSERRQATIAAILAAARKRFAQKGFAETTIDEIAQSGGVAKGAVYHHFSSKEEIFEQVTDALMAEIAQAVPIAARAGKDPLDALARGTQTYLSLIAEPGARRILLADGPAVLGWEKVRDLDIRHFGRMLHVPVTALLRGRKKPREIDALSHLLTGALNEAALVTALAEDPAKTAREMSHAFRMLLSGLLAPATDGSEPSAS